MSTETEEKLYWYWLANVDGVGSATREKLFRCFATAKEVFSADKELLLRTGIAEKAADALRNEKYREKLCEKFHKMQERGIYFVTKQESSFPERLKNLPGAPDWLFYRGELPKEDMPSVAIIGARECSAYGKGVAKMLASELASVGIQIVSGMARGIDGHAQRAALTCGKSFAVLGSGVDVCYPMENFTLYEQLEKKGGILSEYVPKTLPRAFYFPQRNRILSGLADGVVVVEARQKSGTLITVECALAQGKEVFAVPGRLGEPLSAGCNALIRQGAHLVETSRDILEVLWRCHPKMVNSQKKIKNKFFLEEAEKIVYAYLRLEPRHIEELFYDMDFALPKLSQILFSLEAKGIVYSPAQGYYALCTLQEEI